MSIGLDPSIRKRGIIAAASVAAIYMAFGLLPSIFVGLNARAVDWLFHLRSGTASFKPAYNDTIVHLDINDSSLQALGRLYLDRSVHAQVIRNLGAVGVAAQVFDFIFAAPGTDPGDSDLISAVSEAETVYFGAGFRLLKHPLPGKEIPRPDPRGQYLKDTAWPIRMEGHPETLYFGVHPMPTFPALASAARGLGVISAVADPDGVFRRIPLVVRFKDGYYPSLVLRVICDYLEVPPERVSVRPGRCIRLAGAVRPDRNAPEDVVIPIDASGAMIINFIGPWGTMRHYGFSDLVRLSDTPEKLAMWESELSGKLVIVSDVSTGATDIGPVPVDADFPLSGLHSHAIHTILTGAFLKEPSGLGMLVIELAAVLAIAAASLRLAPFRLTLAAVGMAMIYLGTAGVMFLTANLILPMARPVLMMLSTLISVQVLSAIENARRYAQADKAREVLERDLEIGRQIQAGFIPDRLPEPAGWQIAAHFQAARQVAGDFYDVFTVGDRGRIVMVVADVCDKGVGAALFMALIRSLVRAFSQQRFAQVRESGEPVARALTGVVTQTNDYLAETHDRANMFATLFIAVWDPQDGEVIYVNAGHEKPILVGESGVKAQLGPTGPAVGAMPEIVYRTGCVQLNPGDFLFAATDGTTDAKDAAGAFFSRDRLLGLLAAPAPDAPALLKRVVDALSAHMAGAEQFDDVTMVLVHRK